MNIKINGWNDKYDNIRKKIILDIMDIMYNVFKNDALYTNNLEICNISSVSCVFATNAPCTHYDRSRICISSAGTFWCQFVHQLSHELCHCSTSRAPFPQSIKWFDEFICCCSSYLVKKYISLSTNGKYVYMYGINTAKTFCEYLQIKQSEHIYQVENTKDFFAVYKAEYEKDQDLIKKHDVFVYEFFLRIGQNWRGLSFIGKMWKVPLNDCYSIEEYLSRLSLLCDSEENEILNTVIELFGINLSK